jgi:hypothetical protein
MNTRTRIFCVIAGFLCFAFSQQFWVYDQLNILHEDIEQEIYRQEYWYHGDKTLMKQPIRSEKASPATVLSRLFLIPTGLFFLMATFWPERKR